MGAARGGLVSPLPDYNLRPPPSPLTLPLLTPDPAIDEHVDKTILPHIVTHDLIVATQWGALLAAPPAHPFRQNCSSTFKPD